MSTKQQSKRSGLMTALIVIIVLAIVSGLGYVLWQDAKQNAANKKAQTSDVVAADTEATGAATYTDLRKDLKDGTGVTLRTVDDIAKLGAIDPDLAAYFTDQVGTSVAGQQGNVTQQFTIDRIQGSYAAGQTNAVGFYTIWGPKDGDIAIVAGTQAMGITCDALAAAKVPSKLIDGSCVHMTGEGEHMTHEMKAYKQD